MEKSDEVEVSYYKRVMAGHEGCNFARWVWVEEYRGLRAFEVDWFCPVCGMLLGVEGSRIGMQVNVPEGCLFVVEEMAQ